MKKYWRKGTLALPLALLLLGAATPVTGVEGNHQGTVQKKAPAVIDLTGRVEHTAGPVTVPGFSLGGVPGQKPADDSLPVLLRVDSVENKNGKQILKIHLVNHGEQPLKIPVSLSRGPSMEAQEGSTSFLFSIVFSIPGSKESFSRSLVTSSDADAKHSHVVLALGEEAVILLPLPAYIFRAKDVKTAPQIAARIVLSELKIKKQEYKTESIRKVQSVNAVTLSAEKMAELAKGSDE